MDMVEIWDVASLIKGVPSEEESVFRKLDFNEVEILNELQQEYIGDGTCFCNNPLFSVACEVLKPPYKGHGSSWKIKVTDKTLKTMFDKLIKISSAG